MSQTQYTPESIQQLIQNTLGQSTEIIRESEQALNQIKTQYPNEFILAYINLLQTSPHKEIRQFCAIGIRKHLSAYSEQSYTNIWQLLNEQTKDIVKTQLFKNLTNEQDRQVKLLICDAIGEIAGSILSGDYQESEEGIQGNIWPQFIITTFSLYNVGTADAIEATLRILNNVLTYAWDDFLTHSHDLFAMFKNSLDFNNLNVQLAAIKCLSAWLAVIDSKDTKIYEDLLPLILQVTSQLLKNDQYTGQEALTAICEIAEAEPKFFKKNFDLLFKTLQRITQLKEIEDDGIKQLAIEIIVIISERIPSLLKKQNEYLKDLIEMIFLRMINVEDEITNEWMIPPEGYSQDLDTDSDFACIRFGMNTIDRLISSVTQEIVLPLLSVIVQQMLQQSPNWRYKNAALLALSQVGEYIENIEYISPIVQVVAPYILNEHPKLRYAACHCLGQIADDMQTQFQEKFNSHIVPPLIQIMNDSIPRVSSHACAALANIFEGSPSECVTPYMNEALEKAFALIQNPSISIVKENAMNCISAISESTKEAYIPYFDISIPILFNILTTYTQKEYKQLRGNTIECITLMSHSVGKQAFSKYANDIIQLLISIQTNNSNSEENDILKGYLLDGWSRLCLLLQKDILPYMNIIVPSVFSMASEVFKQCQGNQIKENVLTSEEIANKKEKENVNTNDTEDAELAVNLLSVFIDQLGNDYSEYVDNTVELLIPLVNYTINDNIRKSVANCLPKLLKCIINKPQNTNNNNNVTNMSRAFINVLWRAIPTEYEAEVILEQIEALKDIIVIAGRFLTIEEIQEFYDKLLIVLQESDKRQNENENYKQQDDIEDEEINALEKDNELEEELHDTVTDIFGVLFGTHKELTLPIIEQIYNNILIQAFQSTNIQNIRFGIQIICELIEQLGLEHIPSLWGFLTETLLKYVYYSVADIRQPAAYALGVLSIKNPTEFQQISQLAITQLKHALSININTKDTKIQYGNAQDNIVSALGKIVKSQGESINIQELLDIWMKHLPLKYDLDEAIIQHSFLTDICLLKPELIVGVTGSNMTAVLTIFSELINTKISNQYIQNNIQSILRNFIANDTTKSIVLNSVQLLSQTQRNKLEKLI